MTKYVCGFAFCNINKVDFVLLLRKAKPEWQAGLLNGVGGKIELGESARSAMVREFHEETTLPSNFEDWHTFHYERWRSGAEVYFLANFSLKYKTLDAGVMAMEKGIEPLTLFPIADTFSYQRRSLMYNLPYLIEMALALHKRHPVEEWPLES